MRFSDAYQMSKLFETLAKLSICADEFYIARIADEYVGVFESMGVIAMSYMIEGDEDE